MKNRKIEFLLIQFVVHTDTDCQIRRRQECGNKFFAIGFVTVTELSLKLGRNSIVPVL